MKKSHLLGAVCALFLVFSLPAQAATVNGTAGTATSIDDLFIAGYGTYDVTFINLASPTDNSFNNVFSGTPTFWGDGAGASAASGAINVALNGGPWLNVGSPDNENDYLIPFRDNLTDSSKVESARGRNPFTPSDPPAVGGWVDFGTFSPVKTANTVTWVQFSAVPVPAAVWLFGSGLIGLVGIARRKKAA